MEIISGTNVHLPENSTFKKLLEDTGIHERVVQTLLALKGITDTDEALRVVRARGFTCVGCLDVIRHPLVLRTDAGHGVVVEFACIHNNWKFFIRSAV
jgi:hypothetical protein